METPPVNQQAAESTEPPKRGMFARHRRWLTAVLIGIAVTLPQFWWWWYPRPLFVQELPPSTNWFRFAGPSTDRGYINPKIYEHTSRWLPIKYSASDSNDYFYFLDQEQQSLVGPWTPASGRYVQTENQFDAAGRFLVFHRLDTKGGIDPIQWFNPLSGEQGTTHIPPVANTLTHKLSKDGSTLVIAHGGRGLPLRFTIFSLEKETVVSTLEYPERTGPIGDTLEEAATSGFDISPDGTQLALTNSWAGDRRVGEFGVSIIDVRTGDVVRTITEGQNADIASYVPDAPNKLDPSYPRQSIDIGTAAPRFFPNGSGISYRVSRRIQEQPDGRWYTGVGEYEFIKFDFEKGTITGPSIWGDNFPTEISADGSHVFWIRRAFRTTFRVTSGDGSPDTDWQEVPEELIAEFYGSSVFSMTPVPGTTGIVTVHDPAAESPAVQQIAETWIEDIGLPVRLPPTDGDHAFWYDWKTGESFAFRRTKPEAIDGYICQPHRVSLLIDGRGPNARIEVWSAPIRPMPVLFIWITGLATTIVSLLYSRHRQRIQMQPNNNAAD